MRESTELVEFVVRYSDRASIYPQNLLSYHKTNNISNLPPGDCPKFVARGLVQQNAIALPANETMGISAIFYAKFREIDILRPDYEIFPIVPNRPQSTQVRFTIDKILN
ncbi:hypothetical protein [Geitlerinema sp. PCC 9228]|uniref:hypothetical protein n=1 Tax=Geitlerinema sp. PCC 9228 TaxID=111611 RepID=UPI0011148CA4|nr:hypothetical protein [Geitlerinema sp. PCC 9228]